MGISARRASALATLAATGLLPAAADAATRTYVVQLKAAPLASYTGGRAGLPATSPKETGDRRLNTGTSAAAAYSAFLAERERAALAHVPGAAPTVDYSYHVALAGFSAELTPEDAAALREAPEVADVWPDEKLTTQAVDPASATAVDGALGGVNGDTASYLGLPNGLWSQFGGPDHAGDGVVVGVLDTGITPQHPSFADTALGNFVGADYGPPPASFRGTCDAGTDTTFQCNNKLIGARFFIQGFGPALVAPDSFHSPRDDDGHGTHTASIAAGNFGVDPTIGGRTLGVDLISGIAPRARIAAYKVCWVGGDVSNGCTLSDSVAAIDQAVSDGVDVINYSIGGAAKTNVADPVQLAFLGASDAGVFVANAAGNAGPDGGSVATPTTAPWLTSVGADAPARTFQATATITPPGGLPFDITGASVTGALVATSVVDGASSARAGVAAADAELCRGNALDPAQVTGKVVLCKRGGNARIDKSRSVKAAGGVGMILSNTAPGQDIDDDTHFVPAVHVSQADGDRVRAAVAAGPTTASITEGTAAVGAPRALASFSSRGPQAAVSDLAKPDVTAPGVNILAGDTPTPSFDTGMPAGELFQSLSGTSMAAPQVAGAAALLDQAHPGWSPAEIKSALMTTARPNVLEDGSTPATPFDAGAGEIDPTAAASPGLVLEVGTNDYVRYVDSQQPAVFHDGQAPIAPGDLNLPSIAAAKVPGKYQTVRTVTSVDGAVRHWDAAFSVPGFDGSVTVAGTDSSAFDIGPGETRQLVISARVTTAPLDRYAFGAVTLTSGATALRIPVSLRPIELSAPATVNVTADRSAGSATIPVDVGFAGTLSGLGWGLAAPVVHAREQIQTDPTGAPDPNAPSPALKVYDVDVPDGAQLLSGRIANADPGTNLDLFLFRDANGDGSFGTGELVDSSATPGADEGVTEVLPAAGHYRFLVVGARTQAPSAYDFTTWLADDAKPDDPSGGPGIAVTGDPFAVSIGQTLPATLAWSGVDTKGVYLGLATFHDSSSPGRENLKASTIVELTKTADTTSATGAAPAPPAASSSAKRLLAVSRLVTRMRRGRLTLHIVLARRATVTVRIQRGHRTVFTLRRRALPAGRRVLRLRVGHRLRRGRRYRMTVRATSGRAHGRRTVIFRVR
ncbi:MAG: S8 family peptidase [Actinobacteria bacterium]|nr:MAG: S8 family peptidase [Actinomycetota bacterium]